MIINGFKYTYFAFEELIKVSPYIYWLLQWQKPVSGCTRNWTSGAVWIWCRYCSTLTTKLAKCISLLSYFTDEKYYSLKELKTGVAMSLFWKTPKWRRLHDWVTNMQTSTFIILVVINLSFIIIVNFTSKTVIVT